MNKYTCFGDEYTSVQKVYDYWKSSVKVGYSEFHRFYQTSKDLEFTISYFIKKAKYYNPMKRKVRPKATFSLSTVAKFKTSEERELRKAVADKIGKG